MSAPSIVYCRCAFAQVIPDEVKDETLRRLADSGVPFEAVPDLCAMSARKDPALRSLAERDDVRIVACYPRAVRWLFRAAGAPLAEGRAELLNMRTDPAEDVVARALAPRKSETVHDEVVPQAPASTEPCCPPAPITAESQA